MHLTTKDCFYDIHSTNQIENNIVNGKPLVYLENVNDYVVEDAGQVVTGATMVEKIQMAMELEIHLTL